MESAQKHYYFRKLPVSGKPSPNSCIAKCPIEGYSMEVISAKLIV